jgi:uncharacterized membrane protein
MLLPIVIVGLALFIMAFIGLNRFVPTLFGLGSVVGVVFSLYLMYLGFIKSDENKFIWGCLLLLAAASVLVYLKSAWSD